MTVGGLRRRLLLSFLGVCGLFFLYILCVSLQVRVPWRMVEARLPLPGYARESRPQPSSSSDSQSLAWDTPHPGAPEGQEGQTPGARRGAPTPPSKLRPRPTRAPTPRPPPPTPERPTEPPYIGDRYAREEFWRAQSNCSSGIRRRVAGTDFGARFLADVPVLQWRGHISAAEYERLRRYPGVHGWGGVDFDTLVSCLSILNASSRVMFDDWDRRSNGSTCVSCAVVGNGGILNGSGKGQEIDQHDYVFRVNGAVIEGFEEDVGSRTSFYTFSTNTMRNSMRSYASAGYHGPPVSEETRYIFLPDHDRDYILLRAAATHTPIEKGPERSKDPPRYFGEHATADTFKIYHPDSVRYLRNRFLRSSILRGRYRNIYRPSTGAVMLLAALHTCDQVSAYGFMTPDYKNYSDHYYDKKYRRVGFFANHDLRMEMSLWQQLHRAGLIRLYMRE
ncbi:hypothetical protein MATL_G00000880 [Megalops atlanticus]|uniref:alpha-N-acetylgalactosaminide alpha-2,6-sialyltransferase n=1 Tax=Megalops atlanticus TaxID=7932 RepID=A0A9D3QEE4_MEGAT|nr:hypothetical protein MATL_G00000880 [Megalops atlanticus]